ncbi:MAG: helix-turn-helix domain-containing protein [Marinifilaceae bacterium]|jgi:AraC-like DNA-binding protein|nr:helix-turn-helix domain-containing protein [Marinifilaceae bacterium]
MSSFLTLNSISELHKILGCPKPKHPAISFIPFSKMNINPSVKTYKGAIADFYIISLKNTKGKFKYGRNYYDFDEGSLIFTSPNQVLFPDHLADEFTEADGWSLIFHPDILYQSDLGNKIDRYKYFNYNTNEALHLSEKEKIQIMNCIDNIIEEYSQNIDKHSQSLIVSNLGLLLNYCTRFYDRQFITRAKQNTDIISGLESLLKDYFNTEKPSIQGLPSVKYCAQELNLSANYLSDLLKKETGKNTKEHIDYYLLERAKNLLLSSNLNINEIAYKLDFESPKSFSKLFKKKTGNTPSEYKSIG